MSGVCPAMARCCPRCWDILGWDPVRQCETGQVVNQPAPVRDSIVKLGMEAVPSTAEESAKVDPQEPSKVRMNSLPSCHD